MMKTQRRTLACMESGRVGLGLGIGPIKGPSIFHGCMAIGLKIKIYKQPWNLNWEKSLYKWKKLHEILFTSSFNIPKFRISLVIEFDLKTMCHLLELQFLIFLSNPGGLIPINVLKKKY